MTHNLGKPTDAQRRHSWRFGIGLGLASAALASGATLAAPASAAAVTPASAITVPTDDDSDNPPPRKGTKSPKQDLRLVTPHTVKTPRFYPPVCENKPWLSQCPNGVR